MKLLFDSDVLIRFLNNESTAAFDRLLVETESPSISRITWIEVLVGVPPEREERVRVFLAGLQMQEVTPEIAERALRLRKTTRLKLPDSVIYATALVMGGTLVTLNTRDFPPGTDSVLIPN